MDPYDALRGAPVLAFAKGGASRRAEANTVEAFTLALRLGATGIETTAHTLADGTVVVRDRAHMGSRLRRRPLASMTAEDLPPGLVTLEALIAIVGPTAHLLLHIGSQTTFEAVIETTRRPGNDVEDRIWLATEDLATLVRWRPRTGSRLILWLGPRKLARGAETTAAELRSADIDGLGLFHSDWTPGQVTMLNRFGRCTVGWGAEYERELARLFRCGLNAVSSDFADRLAAVAGSFTNDSPEIDGFEHDEP